MPKPVTDVPFETDIRERLDTLIDGIASANRAARIHAAELRATRSVVIAAMIFCFVLYLRSNR